MMDEYKDQDIFGCVFCAGVGYEDYPMCKKPCRISGHEERHKKNVDSIINYFNENPLPEPIKKPIGNWEWVGRGWRNLNYKKEISQ